MRTHTHTKNSTKKWGKDTHTQTEDTHKKMFLKLEIKHPLQTRLTLSPDSFLPQKILTAQIYPLGRKY